jgi:beta-phosphoglucomutase-like phosphatase (HAD superfamily)
MDQNQRQIIAIQAIIFDLDGTLVQTEIIKAQSYARAARDLSLVIEDSATGVKAALAAKMGCIAVTTDFTRKQLHAAELLPKRWIVDDPVDLDTAVQNFIASKEKEKRTIGTTG